MENIKNHLSPSGKYSGKDLVPGNYSNGFVGFTIMHITHDKVLLYANSDIPFLHLSEDESLEMDKEKFEQFFNDILSDFRLTHALEE